MLIFIMLFTLIYNLSLLDLSLHWKVIFSLQVKVQLCQGSFTFCCILSVFLPLDVSFCCSVLIFFFTLKLGHDCVTQCCSVDHLLSTHLFRWEMRVGVIGGVVFPQHSESLFLCCVWSVMVKRSKLPRLSLYTSVSAQFDSNTLW